MTVNDHMKVKLAKDADAEIVPGVTALATKPRWALRTNSLLIGPYHNGLEHEQHYLATRGSGDWHASEDDEFRFDTADSMLRSMWLHAGRRNLIETDFLSSWFEAPLSTGSLRLINQTHFSPAPVAHRLLDPQRQVLAGVHPAVACAAGEVIRLRVAPDCDLVFSDQNIAGWMLWNPTRYLTNGWADPVADGEPEAELTVLVRNYLELASEPNFAAMERKDPVCLKSMLDLRERVAKIDRPDAPANIVRESLDAVIEKFYGPVEKSSRKTTSILGPT